VYAATTFQICRYLDDAPDDPEGILLFGTLNLILNNVLVDAHPTSDIATLKFYMKCHCDIGQYVVPPDICDKDSAKTRAVRLSQFHCAALLVLRVNFQPNPA